MKESERLTQQFKELFNGQPWIDVSIIGTLSGLTAKQAAAKPFSHANSVWQIVNHLVSWRETVLKRLQGENIPSPDNNFFEPVDDISEQTWRDSLTRFEATQDEWMKALKNADEIFLETVWQPAGQTNYELILGILQHDAYHLGQVVLLKKFI
jgi:uncharacterized damage-inducible protein DinB